MWKWKDFYWNERVLKAKLNIHLCSGAEWINKISINIPHCSRFIESAVKIEIVTDSYGSELKPSIFESWFGSGLKIFESKPCRNRRFLAIPNRNSEKRPEKREIKSEPQKPQKTRRFGTVKNCQFGTETGGFGTGTVTVEHPCGSVPIQQFQNRNRRFLNRGHL